MLKSDWIKLINAIRLRKMNYRGKDGELSYQCFYNKVSESRKDLEKKKDISFTYEKSGLEFSGKNNTFYLNCLYNYEIKPAPNEQESCRFDRVFKTSVNDIFIDHICAGNIYYKRLSTSFANSNNTDNFFYHAGFYAAAFLYAVGVKEPKMQLIDQEWIVIDEKLGHFDFVTYFSYPITIPIKLPVPKIIDLKTTSNFQLAEGLEIADVNQKNYEQASKYLDDIRKEIQNGLLE